MTHPSASPSHPIAAPEPHRTSRLVARTLERGHLSARSVRYRSAERRRFALLFSAATLALCVATTRAEKAAAQTKAVAAETAAHTVARVMDVRQPTQLRSTRGAKFVAVRARSALGYGSTVRTLQGGYARIMFLNGTVVTLRANTTIEIKPPATPQRPLVLRLSGQTANAWVRPRGNVRIITSSGNAVAQSFAASNSSISPRLAVSPRPEVSPR